LKLPVALGGKDSTARPQQKHHRKKSGNHSHFRNLHSNMRIFACAGHDNKKIYWHSKKPTALILSITRHTGQSTKIYLESIHYTPKPLIAV
jgi:hypothetical protein